MSELIVMRIACASSQDGCQHRPARVGRAARFRYGAGATWRAVARRPRAVSVLRGGDRRRARRLRPAACMIRHHFTVDVEEYFQVSAFETIAPPARWDGFESRVRAGVARLLDALAAHRARATFFVLGWVAARQPGLVREIAAAGHEIGSHGWDHARVTRQTPARFRETARRSKAVLEDLSGRAVLGFRAPSFSIVPGREWALDALVEEGYRYDSSLFPIRRLGYGYPGAGRDPHWLMRPAGRLAEIPPATLRVCGVTLPAGGGAYFRLLPYGLVRAALRASERRGAAATFYLHPWEVDPEQPRLAVPWPTRIRHYGGLDVVPGRLDRLLSDFRFTAVADTLADMTAGLPLEDTAAWGGNARGTAARSEPSLP